MSPTQRALPWAVVLCAVIVLISSNPLFAETLRSAVEVRKSPVDELAAKQRVGAGEAPGDYRAFSRAKVGQSSEPEVFTLAFHGSAKVTGISASADFHVTGGSCSEGHTYAAGDECSVEVAFAPQGPGHRTGKLTVAHTAASQPMVVLMGGDAVGPALSFIPAHIATIPATYPGNVGLLLNPQRLAVDDGDNLYMVDTGNNLIRYMDSSGAITTLIGGGKNPPLNFFNGAATTVKLNHPYGVAVDAFDDVIVTDTGDDLALGMNANGNLGTTIGGGTTGNTNSWTLAALCPFTTPINSPYSVVYDATGNEFLSISDGESTGAYVLEGIVYGASQGLSVLGTNEPDLSTYPIAVDVNDSVYYTTESLGSTIEGTVSECHIAATNYASFTDSPGGHTWMVAGSRNCGFSGDGGLALGAQISSSVQGFAWDAAGNFYFTDTGNQRVRRIDAKTGIIRTIGGNGIAGNSGNGGEATAAEIHSPTGIAVDSRGNVYVTDLVSATGNAVVAGIGYYGELTWGTVAIGTSAPTETILVSNTGNDTANFAHFGLTSGNTGDFAIDPNTTTCLTTEPLPSGDSCVIGIIFTPVAIGQRLAYLTLADNTVSGSNQIELWGSAATPAAAVLSPTSLTFASQTVNTSSAAQPVKLTNTGGLTLTINSYGFTGTNPTYFSQTHNCGATLAAGAFCTIDVTFKPLAAGSPSATLSVATSAGAVTATLGGTSPAGAAIKIPLKQRSNTIR